MDNNGARLAEIGLFLTPDGLGVGWGTRYEDGRWGNEIKLYRRRDFFVEGGSIVEGVKAFLLPYGYSMWNKKEIAHETFYGWGFLGLYVDIPNLKLTCGLLKQ